MSLTSARSFFVFLTQALARPYSLGCMLFSEGTPPETAKKNSKKNSAKINLPRLHDHDLPRLHDHDSTTRENLDGGARVQGPLEWGSWGVNAARGCCFGQLRSK
jgi:hypothetical protein